MVRLLALGLVSVLLVGCGSATRVSVGAPPTPVPSTDNHVPIEFRSACGHPHATVETARLHVVIRAKDCDLSEVVIANQGRGVTVPPLGDPGGLSNSAGVTVQREAATGDVTFDATADTGNG